MKIARPAPALSKLKISSTGGRNHAASVKQAILAVMFLILMLLIANCAGPQPLHTAINSSDEQTYVSRLNASNADARRAYASWVAAEQNSTIEQVLQADSQLSQTRNPFDAHSDARAVSRGAVIYQVHCARCHGDDARGKGPSILPDHPATDFKTFGKRFAATVHRGAPRKWFRVIRDGSGDQVTYPDGAMTAMPGFGDKLLREQIWLVITYLQSLDVHTSKTVDRGS